MAYPHTQHEVNLSKGTVNSGQVVSATGNLGAAYSPGYVPHIIRSASVRVTTAADGTVKLRKYDAGSSGTLTTVCTFTLTTGASVAATVGNVVYSDPLNQEVQPGEVVEFVVSTAGAAGAVVPYIFVEPRWEKPSNVSGMNSLTA